MDDVKSASEKSVAMPKKLTNKKSFPTQGEIVRMVQANHQRTRSIVRQKQTGAFYTDHGS